MRPDWRVVAMMLAVGLSPAAAVAQTAPATTNAPAPATQSPPPAETVGPSELQNFSLSGKVTRPADQPPASPATSQPQAQAPVPKATPSAKRRSAPSATTEPVAQAQPTAIAPVQARDAASAAPQEAAPAEIAAPSPSLAAPEPIAEAKRGFPLWPWLAAAAALALGIVLLAWRNRARHAFAEPPQTDFFQAPTTPTGDQPQSTSLPEPQARRTTIPAGTINSSIRKPAAGIVSSRLRPSIEIGFEPVRCLVEGGQVVIEFDLELFNSGPAPARSVLAEASMLNASAAQDQELAIFFANPQGEGERLDLIAPMKRIGFRSRVVAPRERLQEYELGGRKAFVPVIAFNALYEWSGGKAQTSAAYLVGRDTRSDKLGPLRLEKSTREVRGLGARELPSALKT